MSGLCRAVRGWLRRHPNLVGWLLVVAYITVVGGFAWFEIRVVQQAIRTNQCNGIRADVTERTIILQNGPEDSALVRYWRDELLPDLRQRYERAECEGDLPRLPAARESG